LGVGTQPFIRRDPSLAKVEEAWTRYTMWLVLGLEFLLAADIIRTFLNFFLTHDVEKTAGDREVQSKTVASRLAGRHAVTRG
jgi:uncharacterized membrane protein